MRGMTMALVYPGTHEATAVSYLLQGGIRENDRYCSTKQKHDKGAETHLRPFQSTRLIRRSN